MPVMTKMRDNMPAILIGLAILFVAMIIFDWGMDLTGRRGSGFRATIVGKVNGEEISYPDFDKMYQSALDNYKNSAKEDPDDQTITQIRDEVWQEMVNQILVKQEAEKLGITVTDQELKDWVNNDPESLPDVIKRNFEDSTGHLDLRILRAAQNDNRPEVQQFWVSVQEYLKEKRLEDKLTSRLYSAIRIPESELRERFEQQSEKFEAAYVLVPPAVLFPDSSIQVNESEVHDYYSSHQENYRTQPTRNLEYVVFPIRPSAADSTEVQAEMNRVAGIAKGGADFLELVKEYSETPYDDKFISHGQMDQTVEKQAFAAQKGTIIGPFTGSDGYHLIKVMDEQDGKNVFIHAAHILLRVNPGPDSIAAYTQARQLITELRGGADFAALARQYSQDPGSAQQGGDLGWFGKGMMVKPFEDAAFKAGIGQVVGPVRTQFGLHIIKVLGKDSRELKIADIKMSVKTSQQSKDDLKQHAEDFIYVAKQDGFDKAANTMNVRMERTPSFAKGRFIPGVGQNDDLMKWIFDGKLGDISDVTTISQGYAVFMISDVKDAGVTPFEQVSAQIRTIVKREKQYDQAQKYADQLLQKLHPGDSLKSVIQYDGRIHYGFTGSFGPSGFVPEVGRDMGFVAEALKLNPGQISPAIKGTNGVYALQLLNKTTFDTTAYKIQRITIMQQLMQQEKTRIVNDWLQSLKESASIEDNRSQIFR